MTTARSHTKGILVCRQAILSDLQKRYEEGDDAVKMNVSAMFRNRIVSEFVSGEGTIRCPECGDRLSYNRSSNGKINAACSNPACVRWME